MTPSIYLLTSERRLWLNQRLLGVEQSSFEAFHDVRDLCLLVRDAERGKRPRWVAEAAIRERNEEESLSWSYAALRDHDCDHILMDCGGWVLFTEDPMLVLQHAHLPLDECLLALRGQVTWMVFVPAYDGLAIVYASPWTGERAYADDLQVFCDGDALTGQFGHGKAFIIPTTGE